MSVLQENLCINKPEYCPAYECCSTFVPTTTQACFPLYEAKDIPAFWYTGGRGLCPEGHHNVVRLSQEQCLFNKNKCIALHLGQDNLTDHHGLRADWLRT